MPIGSALASGIAGAAGAIFGGGGDESETTKRLNLSGPGGVEVTAFNQRSAALNNFLQTAQAGAGAADVTAGTQAQRDLAGLQGQLAETGGLPTSQDIGTARRFGQDIFKARRIGLQQQFQADLQQANRRSAALGRDINDPVLRAKLLQERNRSQERLGAEQQGFETQFALLQPERRLGFAQQRTNTLAGLGGQALQLRQAELGASTGVLESERAFRIQSAGGTSTTQSGGGFAGAVAGLGTGISAGANLAGLFGGGSSTNTKETPQARASRVGVS